MQPTKSSRLNTSKMPDTRSLQKLDKDMSVAEFAKSMQAQLENNRRSTEGDIKKLGETLTTQLHTLKTEISTDIEKLRDDNNKTFAELRSSIERAVTDTNAALDRVARTNDLIVSGVPYVNGENLSVYFAAWCRTLGYKDDCIPLVDM